MLALQRRAPPPDTPLLPQSVILRPQNGFFALAQALLVPKANRRAFDALVLTPGTYTRQICISQSREFRATMNILVRGPAQRVRACMHACVRAALGPAGRGIGRQVVMAWPLYRRAA